MVMKRLDLTDKHNSNVNSISNIAHQSNNSANANSSVSYLNLNNSTSNTNSNISSRLLPVDYNGNYR